MRRELALPRPGSPLPPEQDPSVLVPLSHSHDQKAKRNDTKPTAIARATAVEPQFSVHPSLMVRAECNADATRPHAGVICRITQDVTA